MMMIGFFGFATGTWWMTHLTADWDFWLKLAARGPTHYLPQPLAVGREYQLELRIVGSRLSVSLDGALLATISRAS